MQTVFNYGGTVTITPTASDTPDLEVNIEGTAYNTTWDTNVATTIDNWMASYAQTVADRWGIAAVDGATVLTLANVGEASITVNEADGNVVAVVVTSEQSVDLSFVESISPSAANVLVCDLSAEATDATLTLTFVSASDRKKGLDEIGSKLQAAQRKVGLSVFQTPCLAAIS